MATLVIGDLFAIEVSTKAQDGFTPKLDIGGRLLFLGDFSLNSTTNQWQRDKNEANFYAKSIRLMATGEVAKNIKFWLELNPIAASGLSVPGSTKNELGAPHVLDKAFWTLSQFEFANISLGVFYVPFNRGYQLTSSGKQLFGDRALADTKYGWQRDTGLMVNGDFLKKKFHYWVSITAGSGTPRMIAANGDNSFLVTARIQGDPLGEWKNGEMYFQKDMKLSIGAALLYTSKTELGDTVWNTSNAAGTNNMKDLFGFTADIAFTVAGFYLEAAATYISAKWFDAALAAVGKPNPYFGMHIDLGYMVLPKYLMIAARWDHYQDTPFKYGTNGQFGTLAGTTTNLAISDMLALGLSWYVGGHKHAFKIQPEFQYVIAKSGLQTNASGTEQKEMRVRLAGCLNF